ncbi:MAG: hypothetical protein K0S32_1124 [Bacteroidetes bacterium]|jgi:hypothetical protein|nr:hypothetical protein [Bacteroidota bacterium]
MKKIKLIIAVLQLMAVSAFSQGGTLGDISGKNCNKATKLTLSHTPQTLIQNKANGWYYFVATTRNPDVQLRNISLPNYGSKITSIRAFTGSCEEPVEIAKDTVTMHNDSLLVLIMDNVKLGDTVKLYVNKKFSNQNCSVNPNQCNHDAIFKLNVYETKSLFEPATISSAGLDQLQSINYQKLVDQNLYTSINFITMGDIAKLTPYGKLAIDLPYLGCGKVTLRMTHVEYNQIAGTTLPADFKWRGSSYIFDDSVCTHANITLLRSSNSVIGHLSIEHNSYEIFDLTGGILAICKTNLNLASPAECATQSSSQSSSPPAPASGPCADGKSKVLIFYTPAANNAMPNIHATAGLCIDQLNQIWSNSQISNNTNTVAVLPFSFSETGNIDNDLNSFSNNTTIQNLRNSYGAEIVVLLTGSSYGTINGVAKGIGCPNGASDGFVIVDVAKATSGRRTFAHEVCHLFGARHQDDNTTTSDKGFAFKTGAGWLGFGGIWRKTLMHTLPAGESRIDHISNPTVNFMNVNTGTSNNNNALRVNSLKTHLGSFFPDPVPASFNFAVIKAGCGYGWTCIAEICNGTPYTYHWSISQNGITWIPAATGFLANVYVPWNTGLVKCEVKNQANTVIFTLQKTVVKLSFCNGISFRQGNITQEEEIGIEYNENNVSYSPNPNNGNFSIQINSTRSEDHVDMVLTDLTGKIVKQIFTGPVSVGQQKIEVNSDSKLTPGVYILKASGKSINSYNKIVIQ